MIIILVSIITLSLIIDIYVLIVIFVNCSKGYSAKGIVCYHCYYCMIVVIVVIVVNLPGYNN